MTSNKAKAQLRAERAAAALAETQRRERRRNLLTAVALAVVFVLIVAGGFLINRLNDDSDDVAASDIGSSDYGLVVGQTDAPHEIVVYEDFLCPICGILESTAGARLAQLAVDGKVVIDYRPISILNRFGPYSAAALNAFLVVQDAAGDEAAKAFHDLLFADQPPEEGPFPDDDSLVDRAVEAGAKDADVRPGIEGMAMQDAVDRATAEAGDQGVTGTPTILLDGTVFNTGKDWEEIANNLVAAVE